MSFDLSSISNETRLRAPRIIFLGVEKIGKSTGAADFNEPIFIPINGEEGIDDIRLPKFASGQTVPQFPVCNTMEEVRQCFGTLWHQEHNFQTVVIDSASTLQPLIWREVCEKYNSKTIEEVLKGYNKGQNIAVDTWREITSILDSLRSMKNMSSIIIGHVRVKRFDDPVAGSYDSYEMDVDKLAAAHLYRWADAIFFANTKTIVTKEDVGFNKDTSRGVDVAGDQRFLYTQKRPAHPGGGRGVYGQLPYEIPMPKENPFGPWMDAVASVAN